MSARHIQLVVREAEAAGPGIRRLVLMDPDGWPLPKFRPGAHIDLHLPNGMTRSYSLCGDPAQQDRWVVAVKREAPGRGGSAWLHEALRLGDPIGASLPRCTFPLAQGAARHVFLAGGIGVTPLLCMAQRLAAIDADFTMHYSTRSPERTAFRDEIAASDYAGRVHFHFDDGDAAQKLDLDALLAAPDALRAFGEAGRERWRERFSLDRLAADHDALYRSLF
jgi:vanillate O-demethylase ferredoxin subunit